MIALVISAFNLPIHARELFSEILSNSNLRIETCRSVLLHSELTLYFCPMCFEFQTSQPLLVVSFQRFAEWEYRVHEISVAFSAAVSSNLRFLCIYELPLFKLRNILSDRVFAHPDRISDGAVTWIALICFPVLASYKVSVN